MNKKRPNNNHLTRLRYLLICSVLLSLTGTRLSAQSTTLKLYTSFATNTDRGIPVRFSTGDRGFDHYGTAIALRRDLNDIRFREYELGYFSLSGRSEAYDQSWGWSLRFQTRLFKPLINKQKLKGCFSVAPRLFFAREAINEQNATGYPLDRNHLGFELPVLFNLDLHLTPRWSLIAAANVITTARYWTRGEHDNPKLTEKQREFSWTTAVLYLFNEWRFGVGYRL